MKPNLVTFDTTSNTLRLVYKQPPQNKNAEKLSVIQKQYSYYIEYYRLTNDAKLSNFEFDNREKVFFLNTNLTALRIRNLIPESSYIMRVFSSFNGMQSIEPLQIVFRTKRIFF